MSIIDTLDITDHAMTARDVARLLQLSLQTVYELAKDGTLPSFKVGWSLRFDPAILAEQLRREARLVVHSVH